MPLAPNIADAELVSESLAGNRDAFQRIVERYQSLICSLAYSATGSLSQSEDFAQETFITAWKELPALREPAKLRPWLCGIVRYRIGKSFRRQQHEPVHNAAPLDEISTTASPEPAPLEQTISHEEEAILWRSLEQIPETYREPLILFYREHQSIVSVATDLDLSEDAVKQRLSRGRKLLQEQVLSFVEGTLERTRPDKAFALGVIAALPLLAASSAKAATASAAAKGSTTLKILLMTKTTKTIIAAAIVLAVISTPIATYYYWNPPVKKLTSIHIRAEMRTPPGDNFCSLDINGSYVGGFVSIDLWKQFGANQKWRVEKPGRVAVMDGQSTIMYFKSSNEGVKIPQPTSGAFDSGWFMDIANAANDPAILIRNARRNGWNVKATKERGADGRYQSVVTIKTNPGLPENDYLRNKTIYDLDSRQVYRFNARTRRLESAEIDLVDGDVNMPVFMTRGIDYNQPINPAKFHPDLPADISWYQEPQTLPDNQKYVSMTATEAAADFFQACSQGDWDEVGKFMSPITADTKKYLGGLTLISLGQPFKSKSYGGIFVPYEIKLQETWFIRVSNVNPAKRWVLLGTYDDQLRPAESFNWSGPPEILTNNDAYARLSPVDAVKAYFDAQAKLDWVEMRKFTSQYDVDTTRSQAEEAQKIGMDPAKTMPLFQSGEAFYSAKDSAWFVKCQITQTRKWNLALRKDNAAKRWQEDGGL